MAFAHGKPQAALLVYRGLATPAVLSYGAPDLVAGLLRKYHGHLPEVSDAKLQPEHEIAFREFFRIMSRKEMWTLGLHSDDHIQSTCHHDIRRLIGKDQLTPIQEIYSRYYPENWFAASQLESGVYFGLFISDNLVCIAGTHVFAPNEGVAVLGNIATVQSYRNRGFARVCTSRLVDSLREHGCHFISLQVESKNMPAIATYRRLGFEFQNVQLQAELRR